MNKQIIQLLAVTAFLSFCTACSDDDPTIPNEEEVITTLILELEDEQGNDVELKFEDLDGDGGNAPVISAATLSANTTYSGHLELVNETAEEEEEEHEDEEGEEHEDEEDEEHGHEHGKDVSAEVKKEGHEHQVFYVFSSSVDATVDYTEDDVDVNGEPLGLEVSLVTGNASSGTLTITLRHEPKKPNDGTLTDAGGSTDIEVTFDVVIE